MPTMSRERAAGNIAAPPDGSWPALARLVLKLATRRLQITATRKAIGRHRRRIARRNRRERR